MSPALYSAGLKLMGATFELVEVGRAMVLPWAPVRGCTAVSSSLCIVELAPIGIMSRGTRWQAEVLGFQVLPCAPVGGCPAEACFLFLELGKTDGVVLVRLTDWLVSVSRGEQSLVDAVTMVLPWAGRVDNGLLSIETRSPVGETGRFNG